MCLLKHPHILSNRLMVLNLVCILELPREFCKDSFLFIWKAEWEKECLAIGSLPIGLNGWAMLGQDLGTTPEFPSQIAWAPAVGSYSATFPGALSGSWIRSIAAGALTGTHTEYRFCKQRLNPLCYEASSGKVLCTWIPRPYPRPESYLVAWRRGQWEVG